MEKLAKSNNMLLKFLPKSASVVEKRSDNATKLKTHVGKGFSGPIVPMIQAKARPEPKINSSFQPQEPTSPKVSCMGQIKHKNKNKIKQTKKIVSLPKDFKPVVSSPREGKKKPYTIKAIFNSAKPARKSNASAEKPPLPDRAPSLSQMKMFASGRDKIGNLDWMLQIAPVDLDNRNYCSDEDRESEGEEEQVIFPFSAAIMFFHVVV
ncbi:hypothetical protein F0562_027080 [Nyssa sinensis]|uniref:Uncharacterized protein n=1 Tax=Nyssa sinensis TaxID=561372 RepID=A0A5J5B6J2_9ASTE|nr:hypothetical protein F0562_027080 [Nyssa sinensis]